MRELKQVELGWEDIENAIDEYLADRGYTTTGVLRCFTGSQQISVSSLRVEVEKSAVSGKTTD